MPYSDGRPALSDPFAKTGSRPSRRSVVGAAAWSAPVIVASVATPVQAVSVVVPTVSIGGVPATVVAGASIANVSVSAEGNPSEPVSVMLPEGFVWEDGTPSSNRVIGNGPGVFPVPAFTPTTARGYATFTASTATATDLAVLNVLAATYEMTVLGAMNVICDGPDEFRADLAVVVPKGVRPKKMEYAYYPTRPNNFLELKLVTGDIRKYYDQQYAIQVVQDLGDGRERLFIACIGDSDVDNIATATYDWPIRATWPDGTQTTVTFPVLQQHRGDDGRPVGVNAWDHTTHGLPGADRSLSSQAGWGSVVAAGSNDTLNGYWFHADALNSGRSSHVGNDITVSAYYQWVHEDGTPASVTPTPRGVDIPNHSGYTDVRGILLGGVNQLGTSFTLDKPGYWKLLLWPQTSNSKSTVTANPDGVAWNPATDIGHQIGSAWWKIPTTL